MCLLDEVSLFKRLGRRYKQKKWRIHPLISERLQTENVHIPWEVHLAIPTSSLNNTM
jgi:hypothetical protein